MSGIILQHFQNLNHYIVEFLQSDKGRSLLSKYFIGAAMPHLRFDDLQRMNIPVPEESILQLITNLHVVEQDFLRSVNKARELRKQLFSIDDPEIVQVRLNE